MINLFGLLFLEWFYLLSLRLPLIGCPVWFQTIVVYQSHLRINLSGFNHGLTVRFLWLLLYV